MNCDTGHLVRDIEMVDALRRAMYTELPDSLKVAADKKLNGLEQTMVSLSSGGKLSQFAGATRKERRKNMSQLKKLQKKLKLA